MSRGDPRLYSREGRGDEKSHGAGDPYPVEGAGEAKPPGENEPYSVEQHTDGDDSPASMEPGNKPSHILSILCIMDSAKCCERSVDRICALCAARAEANFAD